MSESASSSGDVNVGCGCFSLIAGILALWALCFGLPTTWGTLHVDLFPPGVYLKK